MYKILIADDEQIERDGIKFLIEKYNLQLDVAEAEDGEEALEFLKSNPVDILFTDIKMPFMDGLELSKNARELYPNLKIIIFSAYGEFDYAKKAINVNVSNYVLKPIDVDEFFIVLTNVLELCRREQIEKEKNRNILEIYKLGIESEKEKALLDMINGIQADVQFNKRIELTGMDFTDRYIEMVLFDFRSKFFDAYNEEFKNALNDNNKWEFEYLNLNERQSVIFLLSRQKPFDKKVLRDFAEEIKNRISQVFNESVTIIIGNEIQHVENIYKEFEQMETMLDYKFFFNESIILFAEDGFSSKPVLPKKVNADETNKKVIKDILSLIEANYMKDISLEWIAESVYLSPSYLSYLFKKEMGHSLVKYITLCRLEKARELLQNTNMKIADISEKVGYLNISYFCLTFKSYFGISPSKYREKEE